MEETWAHAPGPLLYGLGQHLNVRDMLRARLTCKHWHAALSLAPLPACAVMPFPGHALHCPATASSHPLSTARLLVLHCDEIRYGSLCGHEQPFEGSHGSAAGAAESLSVDQNIQAQVEQLCKACCTSCSQVRLQFWTAASRLSAPPEDPRAAAWTGKVLKSLVLFAPHIRLLHIDLGKHNGPDTLSLEHIRRLPCLSDFHLSCSSITAEHAQVIFQLTGLQVLSLRSAARQRGEPWWALPALLGPAKELSKLTSLVLDAPGLLSPQSPLPSLLASWPRLHKLELLGEPSPLADAGPQSASLPLHESKLAPLMEMPALQALSLSIRVLTPADWAILSTLCERQLSLCTLNGWKLESGPRGLTALETPDLSSLTRLGASDDSESALKDDQIGLGLSMCKVAKACLRHPAQLPLLLNRGTGAGLHACQVRNTAGPQGCPVEVLHLAFDDGHEDACEDGSPDSPTRQRQEVDSAAWYCRSAWSAILGCFALTELNIARAHKLPLTDEVCAELRHRTPVLQVFQYNGFMEITDGGWASLSSMSKLHTLALGSIKPTESVNAAFVEFSVHLHQLPQQLQCLSLLNAAIHGASSAAGFPPDLRQLSLKFCRLVDGHGPASQGASDLSGLTGVISKLTGLLHLHMSLDETGSPECWGQLASMHSLEDLTLVLSSGARSFTCNHSPLQVLHQIARIPNLQHLKFYAPSVNAGAQQADLQFTREDLDSITSKLKYLRSLELGPLRSDCSQDSRPVGMLHPTQDVAPALATQLPHCSFKLLVNDLLEAINSISQLDQQLQETEDAGSETLDDPELNAELDALQLEDA